MNFKKIFERLQKAWIFSSLLSIVLGIILLFFPSITIQVVCYLLGGLAILYGIGRVIRYARQGEAYPELFRGDLMIGLFLIAIGLFIVFRIEFVAGFIPVIFGIALLASGIGGVQRSMDAKRAGYERWVALLLLAALTIALGLVLVLNPFASAQVAVAVIGASLIYDGLTDVLTILLVGKRIDEWKKNLRP